MYWGTEEKGALRRSVGEGYWVQKVVEKETGRREKWWVEHSGEWGYGGKQ